MAKVKVAAVVESDRGHRSLQSVRGEIDDEMDAS